MLMSIYLAHARSHTRLHAIILLHALPDNPIRSRLCVSCALADGLGTQRPATDTCRELSRDQALEFMRRVLVPRGTKELSHTDFVAVLHLISNHFEQEHQIKMQNAVHIDPNSTPAGSETWRERRQHIDGRDRINRLGSDALQSLSRLGGQAQQPSHPSRPQSCGGRTSQSAPSTSKTLPHYVPRLGLEWASILAPPKVEQPSCSREGCPNSVPYTVHVDESGPSKGSSVITALAQVSCSSCSEQYCSQACQRAAWSQGHKKTCLRKALHRLHATSLDLDLHTTPPSSPVAPVTTSRRPHTARPAVFYSIPPVFGGKKASSTMSVQAGIAAQRCPSAQGDAAATNGAAGDAAHSEMFEDVAEWESRFLPRRQSRSRLSARRAASAAPAHSGPRDAHLDLSHGDDVLLPRLLAPSFDDAAARPQEGSSTTQSKTKNAPIAPCPHQTSNQSGQLVPCAPPSRNHAAHPRRPLTSTFTRRRNKVARHGANSGISRDIDQDLASIGGGGGEVGRQEAQGVGGQAIVNPTAQHALQPETPPGRAVPAVELAAASPPAVDVFDTSHGSGGHDGSTLSPKGRGDVQQLAMGEDAHGEKSGWLLALQTFRDTVSVLQASIYQEVED
jgi:hypothetical protein